MGQVYITMPKEQNLLMFDDEKKNHVSKVQDLNRVQ